MTVDDILVHPAIEPCVRAQAQSLLMIQEASPRIASLFATQQRWLMAHVTLAQYFRSEARDAGTGLLAERFLESAKRHTLASRNTAAAFLKEMSKYDIVRFVDNSDSKRQRPLMPAPTVQMALFHWHTPHLTTLDGLEGGARAAPAWETRDRVGITRPSQISYSTLPIFFTAATSRALSTSKNFANSGAS
jgi:hypothetical protein